MTLNPVVHFALGGPVSFDWQSSGSRNSFSGLSPCIIFWIPNTFLRFLHISGTCLKSDIPSPPEVSRTMLLFILRLSHGLYVCFALFFFSRYLFILGKGGLPICGFCSQIGCMDHTSSLHIHLWHFSNSIPLSRLMDCCLRLRL